MNNFSNWDSGVRIGGRVRFEHVSAQSAIPIPKSRIQNPKSSGGFTLLELIVVISIVAILAGSLLSRIPFYQEQAEKAAMEYVSGAVQSALTIRYSALLARGATSDKELRALASDNPMNWLAQKPSNYAGEYFDPSLQTIPPGSWYFDLKSHELVYAVDRASYFMPGKSGRKWIRFHTKVVYEPTLGQAKSGKEVVATLFEPVEPYHWME